MVETTDVSCFAAMPPVPEPVAADFDGPSEGCPERYEFCAPPEAALAVVTYVAAMQRWVREAEQRCRER